MKNEWIWKLMNVYEDLWKPGEKSIWRIMNDFDNEEKSSKKTENLNFSKTYEKQKICLS